MSAQLRVPFEVLEQVCSIKVLEDLYQLVTASLQGRPTGVEVGMNHEKICPPWCCGDQGWQRLLILSILSPILFLLSWDFAGSEYQWMASWAQSRPSKPLHRNRSLRHWDSLGAVLQGYGPKATLGTTWHRHRWLTIGYAANQTAHLLDELRAYGIGRDIHDMIAVDHLSFQSNISPSSNVPAQTIHV